MKIFFVADIFFIISIIIGVFLLISVQLSAKRNHNYPKKKKVTSTNLAFLLPARDESKVIGNLLESIKKQTVKVKMEDVYVIIESKEDPTKKIAEKYGATVIIRKRLDLRRKGYALDEAIKYILSGDKRYDYYFVFDADNILKNDYLENMLDTIYAGYDIGVGYRNTKNGNENVIAAASSLTFSLINTLGNDAKNRDTRNVTISGTGFYIRSSIIDKTGGYPFHTLTEDYELTLYSALYSLTSYYNKDAEFYDEQPTSFKVSLIQRTRWIKGFMESRKIYAKKLLKSARKPSKNVSSQHTYALGVIPYIIMVVGFLVNLVFKLCGVIYFASLKSLYVWILVDHIFILLLLVYLVLFLLTGIMLYKENKKLDLNLKSKMKVLLFNPIFLISFIYCAIKAVCEKDIGWVKIEHKS